MYRTRRVALAVGCCVSFAACSDVPTDAPSGPRSAPIAGHPPAAATGNALLETGIWRSRTSISPPRAGMAADVLRTSIYVVGGGTAPELRATSRVDAYDVETRIWSLVKPLPAPRFEPYGATTIDGKLYVAGGTTSRDAATDPQTPLKTLFAYDPATDAWTRKADLPDVGGCAAGVQGSIRGRLYVYAPCATGGDRFYRYNPNTDHWIRLPPPPSGHAGGAAGVIEGRLYLTGGFTTGADPRLNPALDVYDPTQRPSWTTGSPMPGAPREQAFATVLHGRLFVVGGAEAGPRVVGTVQAYDPVTDSWATGPSLPTPRMNGAAAMANGRIFVIGGQEATGQPSAKVEAFNLPGVTALGAVADAIIDGGTIVADNSVVQVLHIGNSFENWGIIEFDLSKLSGPVASAVLKMGVYGSNGPFPFTVDVYAYSADGEMEGADWDVATRFGSFDYAGETAVLVDVTSPLRQLRGVGAAFAGFEFRIPVASPITDNGPFVAFNSMEYGPAAVLEVTRGVSP